MAVSQWQETLAFVAPEAPTWVAEASVAKESSAVSFGKARHTVLSRAFLMFVRASDIDDVHTSFSEPFFPPFRAAMRGSRMFAAAGTKRW